MRKKFPQGGLICRSASTLGLDPLGTLSGKRPSPLRHATGFLPLPSLVSMPHAAEIVGLIDAGLQMPVLASFFLVSM